MRTTNSGDSPLRERQISRKNLLKGTLGIFGAGLGVMATSSAASASNQPLFVTQCCRQGAGGCPTCAGGPVRYLCKDQCSGAQICVCHADVGACYNLPCN